MKTHIAVVGGGFAGLAAAHELFNFGFEVTVLEARQRVGGRVWSTKLPNGAIAELGGEWISSGDQNLFKMAKRFKLSMIKMGVDFRTRSVVNGPVVSPEDQRKAVKIARESLVTMDKKVTAKSTVGEFLDDLTVSEPQRMLLISRLQGSFGADLHDIALRMLGGFSLGESGDYYRIETGNQSLAKAMAGALPDVRLGHVVAAVDHHPGGAAVQCGAANDAFLVEADAVLLAIPVKRLAKLEFNPSLPQAAEEAISSVPMGVAAKLVVGIDNAPPLFAVQDMDMPYWCWTGKGEGGTTRSAVTSPTDRPPARTTAPCARRCAGSPACG